MNRGGNQALIRFLPTHGPGSERNEKTCFEPELLSLCRRSQGGIVTGSGTLTTVTDTEDGTRGAASEHLPRCTPSLHSGQVQKILCRGLFPGTIRTGIP